jgi:hypothetical protein
MRASSAPIPAEAPVINVTRSVMPLFVDFSIAFEARAYALGGIKAARTLKFGHVHCA